jgi:peptidoglycan/xylan/chitin deacetylase (PgdA/CDA1 family)
MISNPIPWPDGACCACAITFDVDADSLIHIARPQDSFNRLNPISVGRYGPTVAVPRILETYRRLGLRQTFFMPGWIMERYPGAVEAILAGGHEIGHHGYLHEDPLALPAAEQRRCFEQALAVHERLTGRRPRGYRAPVYNMTQDTMALLFEHGLRYDSSLMGDDIPYLLELGGKSICEVPAHWGSDDWPPFAHFAEINYLMPVRSPSRGLAASFEEFEAQYEAGGFWMGIWHPFLTGRLARWRVVERWLEDVLATKKVWFATLEEIVAHVERLAAEGSYHPRRDTLPYFEGPVMS